MTTAELKQRAADHRWATWAYLGNQFREIHKRRFTSLTTLGIELRSIERTNLDDPRLPQVDQEILIEEYLDARAKKSRPVDRGRRYAPDASDLSGV